MFKKIELNTISNYLKKYSHKDLKEIEICEFLICENNIMRGFEFKIFVDFPYKLVFYFCNEFVLNNYEFEFRFFY